MNEATSVDLEVFSSVRFPLNKNCRLAATGEVCCIRSWASEEIVAFSSVLISSFEIVPSLFHYNVIVTVLVSGQHLSCVIFYNKASSTDMCLSVGLDAAESRQKGEKSGAFHSGF